jgi:AcrR family transcriptional regulator
VILRAAERLFADRGFGVSLREIGAEAGQRNHSAVQYHFGTKERLSEALFAYRMEPINKRRLELIEQVREAGGDKDLPALADVLVRPLAEHVLAHRGNSSYVRFMARLFLSGFEPEPLAEEYTEGIIVFRGLLAAARPELAAERYSIAYLHMVVVLASLEQRCDDPDFTDEEAHRVVAELYVTMAATLAAPPSAAFGTLGGNSGTTERRQGLGLISRRRG